MPFWRPSPQNLYPDRDIQTEHRLEDKGPGERLWGPLFLFEKIWKIPNLNHPDLSCL
jgi:hypothetical protein